ncbi:MAG: hypothetical protein ACYSVY_08595 [Planctomycetota bacterium]|jgi:hypothetical protein
MRWRRVISTVVVGVFVTIMAAPLVAGPVAFASQEFVEWALPASVSHGAHAAVALAVAYLLLAVPGMLTVGILLAVRRQAPKPGHCRGCGYDLRGSPGPSCPECGVPTGIRGSGLIRKAVIVISTMLAVGVLVAYVAGYQAPGQQARWRAVSAYSGHSYAIRGTRGRLVLSYTFQPGKYLGGTCKKDYFFRFGTERSIPKSSSNRLSYRMAYYVPLWAPLVLFSACPTIAFICGPFRRWRRRRKGLCVRCGYNLTGLPEPRCPECGAAI